MPAQSTPAPGFPGLGELVFSSERDGNPELYRLSPDGKTTIRLTTSLTAERNPKWSPDGKFIAFERIESNGWSQIYVIKGDGSGERRLSPEKRFDGQPDWSPDGKQIVFSSRAALTVSAGDTRSLSQIMVMNVDGSGSSALTSGTSANFAPAWSPDGKWIAYVTLDSASQTHQLNLMAADGQFARTLLSSKTREIYFNNAAWSPDSQWLAFEGNPDGNPDIYKIKADGSSLTRLTNDSSIENRPFWSPDGTLIGFNSNRTGNHELYRMRNDGTTVEQLTNSPGADVDLNCNWGAPPSAGG